MRKIMATAVAVLVLAGPLPAKTAKSPTVAPPVVSPPPVVAPTIAPKAATVDADLNDCQTYSSPRRADACAKVIERGEAEPIDVRVSARRARGDAFLEKGEFGAAVSEFDAALRLDPTASRVVEDRLIALLGAGDYERASADADVIVQRRPTAAEPRAIGGVLALVRGEDTRAVVAFTVAKQIASSSDEKAVSDVMRLFAQARMGDLNGALADVERAATGGSDDAGKLYPAVRGYIHAKLGRFDDAETDLDAVGDPRLRQILVSEIGRLKGDANAQTTFDAAVADLSPIFASIARAIHAIDLKRPVETVVLARQTPIAAPNSRGKADPAECRRIGGYAIEAFTRTIERGAAESVAERASAYTQRATVFEEKGALECARLDLDGAIALDKSYGRAVSLRAIVHVGLGDYDHALQDSNDYVRLRPDDGFTLRGVINLARGAPQNAIDDFTEAGRLDHGSEPTLAFRAFARIRAGDIEGATEDIDRLAASSDSHVKAVVAPLRAYILTTRGELAKADARIAEELKQNPTNVIALAARSEVLRAKGDAPGSQRDFEAAIASLESIKPLLRAVRDAGTLPGVAATGATSQPVLSVAKESVAPTPTVPSSATSNDAPIIAAAPTVSPPALTVPSPPKLRRVALVIGNGAYTTVSALPNPPRDANAMASLFRTAGFDLVQTEANLGVLAMRKAVRTFALAAETADVAVVFFAGHAVEIAGQNFLIPVDAALETDSDVQDEAVLLDRVLEQLAPVKRLKFVILDACRDNPFAARMRIKTASRSVDRGLARPSTSSSNTLIAFAAKAGSTASDGDGQNSPFTAALLKRLATPGLDVRIALGEVHDDVMLSTGNAQEPFLYGALGGGVLALAPARN